MSNGEESINKNLEAEIETTEKAITKMEDMIKIIESKSPSDANELRFKIQLVKTNNRLLKFAVASVKFNSDVIDFNKGVVDTLESISEKISGSGDTELKKQVDDLSKHKPNLEWLDKFFKHQKTTRD